VPRECGSGPGPGSGAGPPGRALLFRPLLRRMLLSINQSGNAFVVRHIPFYVLLRKTVSISYGDLFILWTEAQFLVPEWGDEPAMASVVVPAQPVFSLAGRYDNPTP
jgi:hypothetical protein